MIIITLFTGTITDTATTDSRGTTTTTIATTNSSIPD
jgi:hypothetical protein